MFGGIVLEIGQVDKALYKEGFLNYSIRVSADFIEGIVLGESIAVNGVCQSVTKIEGNKLYFDAIKETLDVTNLKFLSSGSKVNLEKSLRVDDRVSGHICAGHVACMGKILDKREEEGQTVLNVFCPKPWSQYLISKGFVTLEGVSLTVGKVNDGSFEIYLIPDTLRRTTLSEVTIGDLLNIEIDHMTLAVFHAIEHLNLETIKS